MIESWVGMVVGVSALRHCGDAGHWPLSPRASAGAAAQTDGLPPRLGRDTAPALTAPSAGRYRFVSGRAPSCPVFHLLPARCADLPRHRQGDGRVLRWQTLQ